jgi:hypothetical protein
VSQNAFETEEFGFAQELAMQYGFEYTDDDATQMRCTNKQLFTLMKALGYQRVARVRPAPAGFEPLGYSGKIFRVI